MVFLPVTFDRSSTSGAPAWHSRAARVTRLRPAPRGPRYHRCCGSAFRVAGVGMTDGELAIAAAEAGAAVVRARYGGPLERYAKGGTDFATVADLEAEQAILDVIRAARPDDAFLGEEGGLSGEGERTWLVDPLCGTLNFAARTPLVAVNVALRSPA